MPTFRFDKVSSSYEHALGAAYHQIDNRGLQLDVKELETIRNDVKAELNNHCFYLSNAWGFPVYIGKENDSKKDQALNLNSPVKVLERLTALGYKVPKIRKKDEETDEYEMKESANELALRQLLAEPTLWPNPMAGEPIKKLLEVKEVVTFKNKYVNANLYKGQYFSNYNVAATNSGRRGSKKNVFGLGGNAQNFPARGRLSDLWKRCITARPGRLFFFVDQMQAEDWPVQALAQNFPALDDMQKGINRHYKFASAIFNRSIDDLKRGRASGDHQAEMEYNLGKRGRHANNYGMQPPRLSEILAGEGYSVSKAVCTMILETINRIDPNVKGVFHKYIQETLMDCRILRTPLGRERQFFGLRSGEKNYQVFNEAYSYLPQSTVGDNTGMAILYLCGLCDYVVQESHDSIVQEIPDNEESILTTLRNTRDSFKRVIRFHNGIEIEIPIEGALGYDWYDKVKINDKGWEFTEEKALEAYAKLKGGFKNRYA